MPKKAQIQTMSLTDTHDYLQLVKKLKELRYIVDATGTQIQNRAKLTAYWQVGDRLEKSDDLTQKALEEIADKTLFKVGMLYKARQFRNNWQRGLTSKAYQLSWTLHIELLSITDKKARDFYIDYAITKGLGRDALRQAIKKNLYDVSERGELDELPENKLTPMHVYKAVIERVIDGDTLDAKTDAGFNVWVAIRIRLKGINCAEMADGGTAAKQFVIDKLESCQFVAINTHKDDIYGRYLGDVYYHPHLTDKNEIALNGHHLNRELVEAGLAKPMMV